MAFSDAQTSVAIANAPLFLLERLRSDPEVQSVALQTEPKEIYKSLAASLKKKPQTLEDRTLPYVYLVAVALTQDDKLLRRAATLSSSNSKWFSYLATVLVQEAIFTTRTTLENSVEPLSPDVSERADSNTELIDLARDPK